MADKNARAVNPRRFELLGEDEYGSYRSKRIALLWLQNLSVGLLPSSYREFLAGTKQHSGIPQSPNGDRSLEYRQDL
jgi:hypothetical protein